MGRVFIGKSEANNTDECMCSFILSYLLYFVLAFAIGEGPKRGEIDILSTKTRQTENNKNDAAGGRGGGDRAQTLTCFQISSKLRPGTTPAAIYGAICPYNHADSSNTSLEPRQHTVQKLHVRFGLRLNKPRTICETRRFLNSPLGQCTFIHARRQA